MNYRIPFNRPTYTGAEDQYVLSSLRKNRISGDGEFSRRCQHWFENKLGCCRALLTPSCTHALEMAALLIDIGPGDEVIMPSFTFVSTANAFVMRGAKVVFVDIRPDTMNLDERLVEAAVTDRTKAIVVVHYAGIPCEMDAISDIAQRRNLYVIEDAAQAMMSTYKGRPAGRLSHLAAYSFHETKNYTSGGEGGLLIVNDERFAERAEIIREKGTNRSQFFRGMVDKYTWVDIGSSYLLSDVQAAYLWGQLERADDVNRDRLCTWRSYWQGLLPLQENGLVQLPHVPTEVEHNGHMFYIRVRDLEQRTQFLQHLASKGIYAVFHYVPLHSAPAGQRFGSFHGEDRYTTRESERLVRLPFWYGMRADVIQEVVDATYDFFGLPHS